MAQKQIVEKRVVIEIANVPGVRTVIGKWTVDERGYRADDTVGPWIKLERVSQITPYTDLNALAEEPKDYAKELVLIEIGVWNGRENILRMPLYSRSLAEHEASKHNTLLRRYRIPFSVFEGGIDHGWMRDFDASKCIQGEKNDVYVGNPDYDLRPGDVVVVRLLSPYVIDPKKSEIKLEFVRLIGHIGPERVKVR